MKVAMKVIKHLITKYCVSNYIMQLKLKIAFVLFNKDSEYFFSSSSFGYQLSALLKIRFGIRALLSSLTQMLHQYFAEVPNSADFGFQSMSQLQKITQQNLFCTASLGKCLIFSEIHSNV